MYHSLPALTYGSLDTFAIHFSAAVASIGESVVVIFVRTWIQMHAEGRGGHLTLNC